MSTSFGRNVLKDTWMKIWLMKAPGEVALNAYSAFIKLHEQKFKRTAWYRKKNSRSNVYLN